MTAFRTYDLDLREARRLLLRDAAERVAEAVDGSGFEAWVTGSLSRGQVHPWSDLDIVLIRTNPDAVEDYGLEVTGIRAAGEVPADVVFEKDVYEPLQKGMLGSLVRPGDVPPLADLPDPGLAPIRAAFSIETILARIEKENAEIAALAEREGDKSMLELLKRTRASRSYRALAHRMETSLKRLAVFHDGGRSKWLDDGTDMQALEGLLDRLREPAETPFPRPAVMTEDAAEAARWLLDEEQDPDWHRGEADGMERRLEASVAALKDWTAVLRNASDLTETHGLADSPGPKP